MFSKELPERYTAKLLYRWSNKKYNRVLEVNGEKLEMVEEKSVF